MAGERMQWAVTLPDDTKVNLWDLQFDVLATTADELKVSWATIIDSPLSGSGIMARTVYNTVCVAHGQTPIAGLTARDLVDKFELVPEDLPTGWSEGAPNPKAEDPQTGGLSPS